MQRPRLLKQVMLIRRNFEMIFNSRPTLERIAAAERAAAEKAAKEAAIAAEKAAAAERAAAGMRS